MVAVRSFAVLFQDIIAAADADDADDGKRRTKIGKKGSGAVGPRKAGSEQLRTPHGRISSGAGAGGAAQKRYGDGGAHEEDSDDGEDSTDHEAPFEVRHSLPPQTPLSTLSRLLFPLFHFFRS